MTGSRYELRVSGLLSERAAGAVGEVAGLSVIPGSAETTIHAVVVDQAQLNGLLALLGSFDLHIAYMRRVGEAEQPIDGPGGRVTRFE